MSPRSAGGGGGRTAAGVWVHGPWSGERTLVDGGPDPTSAAPLCDATFADDFAIMLVGPTPDECVARLRQVAATTADVFEEWGAELNTEPGKSAGLIALRGRRAREARAQLWITDAGVLQLAPIHI